METEDATFLSRVTPKTQARRASGISEAIAHGAGSIEYDIDPIVHGGSKLTEAIETRAKALYDTLHGVRLKPNKRTAYEDAFEHHEGPMLFLASMRQKVVLLGKWLKAPGELAAAVVAFPALLCLKRNECRESLQYLKSDAGLSHRQMKHCLISHPEVLGYAHKMKARPDAEMRTEQPGDGRRCVRACVGISAHLVDE